MSTWNALLGAWREYLVIAGTPATTIGLRIYHLERLARELGGTPASVTYTALSAWLAQQAWAPNTRRSYRSSLRSFYSWLLATGRIKESPAHLLPPVRVPRGRPRPVPEDIYRAALEAASPRIQLALLLGGACGLRRGEIARARTDHLEPDLTGFSLRVKGKGGHVRLVPVPEELVELIEAAPAGYLFPSKQGGHLTPHYLAKLVSAELEVHTTHALRHRCGTVAYAGTRDLRAVQELLGHAKPETTAIYTAVPDDSIRAAMMAAATLPELGVA